MTTTNTTLKQIPEKFIITYWAKKHQKFITRNGRWTKPDDVMTTGATLYEAARTLHRAGSGPIRGLVLARVLRHGL